MIEHPNLYCTNPVQLFADDFAGMTRFRPLAGSGTPSATARSDGFQNPDPFKALFTTPQTERRTKWVTRVPVRVDICPDGWSESYRPLGGYTAGQKPGRLNRKECCHPR